MKLFQVEQNKDGTVNVRNVPVFKAHSDRRYVCDEVWLDRCVADFVGQKMDSMEGGVDSKYAMLPSVTIGHTPEDPNDPEPDNHGFVDNLRRVGKYLHADFMNLTREVWAKMKGGKLPYRSAEVIPNKFRLTNVSLLGGRYPHFPLPVMRFMTKNGLNTVRYTMSGFDTEQEAPPVGGEEQGGGMDLQALAQQLAPMVAELVANMQGAGVEADMNAEASMPYRARGTVRTKQKPTRYTEHTSKPARAVEDDEYNPPKGDVKSTPGSNGVGEHEEDFKGESMNGKKMRLANNEDLAKYVSGLEEQNATLQENLTKMSAGLRDLQRHRVEEAQASKRMMLRAKTREIAALGYAIGDSEAIERHVERMMPMPVDDVKGYINDVLRQAPKIRAERHGIGGGVVRRPGSGDEAERFVAENPDTVERFGLNADILRLSDVLSGND